MSAAAKRPLSEPQKSLLERLRQGASLKHQTEIDGLFRLFYDDRSRTVLPATVESLLRAGLLWKDATGNVRLVEGDRL